MQDSAEPGRDGEEPSLFELLGLPQDSRMSLIDRSYLQRRQDLLNVDPDWLREEVRSLDQAYRRHLDEWESRRHRPVGMPDRDSRSVADREARNRTRRERAAVRRAAQRELRAELTGQGWPEAWAVKVCQGWQALGGSLDAAQAVDRAGWSIREVGLLLAAGERLSNATIPQGLAPRHRLLGDSLTDLALRRWPAAPTETVLSIKAVWRDGRRERFVILDQPVRRVLRSFRQVQDRWHSTDTSLPPDARLTQMLAAHQDLFNVPAGRSVQAWIDPVLLGDTAIRDLVMFPDDHAEQPQLWPPDIAQEWEDADAELEQRFRGLPWVPRWVRVNGVRVTALRGPPAAGALARVLVDETSMEFVDALCLARYDWFSDPGGAPISWDGGSELLDLRNGLILDRAFGDDDDEPSVALMPEEAGDLGERIAEWLMSRQTGPFAALQLEQLDPAGTLTGPERARWDQALTEVAEFGRCGFDADDEVLQAVRDVIARNDDGYRRTSGGLANPAGPEGIALLATLEEAVEARATGQLQGGDW